MPIKRCQKDGSPGFKYGDSGHCYTYDKNDQTSKDAAYEAARKQGQAIEISKHQSKSNLIDFLNKI